MGLLGSLLRARRAAAVARACAHEEAARHAARQLDGAAGALRFDRRVPMAGRRPRRLATMGAWLHRPTAGDHLP